MGKALYTASKALALARTVKALVNVEHKYFDSSTTLNPSTTPTIAQINAIAQGDTANTRDGNTCRMKSLEFRADLGIHASATRTVVRVIHFLWNDDTPPTWNDILTANNTVSPLNPNLSGKYQILRDRTITLSSTGAQTKSVKSFHKLNKVAKFDGAASTDIQTGAVYQLMMSSEGTNVPSVLYYDRIRFIDN